MRRRGVGAAHAFKRLVKPRVGASSVERVDGVQAACRFPARVQPSTLRPGGGWSARSRLAAQLGVALAQREQVVLYGWPGGFVGGGFRRFGL